MRKLFKIGFWVIGFGWFPMMFLHAASVNWSQQYGLWLILATFLICVTGMFFVLSIPIDHIFKSAETLTKEIKGARDTRIDYLRWIEAVKREAVKKAGLHFADITKCHANLVESKWQAKKSNIN